MRLQHLSTVICGECVYNVSVTINGKEYTYLVHNYAVQLFDRYYKRRATHGKALAVLNKYKIKEET